MQVNQLVNIGDNLIFVVFYCTKVLMYVCFQVRVALFMAFVILKVQLGHQIPLASINIKT